MSGTSTVTRAVIEERGSEIKSIADFQAFTDSRGKTKVDPNRQSAKGDEWHGPEKYSQAHIARRFARAKESIDNRLIDDGTARSGYGMAFSKLALAIARSALV